MYCQEKFENTKSLNRRTDNTMGKLIKIRTTTQKTKDWTTQTPLTENEPRCPGRESNSCSTSGAYHVTIVNCFCKDSHLFLFYSAKEIKSQFLKLFTSYHYWCLILNALVYSTH